MNSTSVPQTFSLGSSAENYLKEIYIMQKQYGFVRSIDLASHFGYVKSTISIAMKSLIGKGLVMMDEGKCLVLTKEGKRMAQNLHSKYTILLRFLVECLDIPVETAQKEACRMEHTVSDETCMCLTNRILTKAAASAKEPQVPLDDCYAV